MGTRRLSIRRLRSPLEAGAFLAGLGIVPWLPRRAVMRLASQLGNLAYSLDGRSRRIALANLNLVLPSAGKSAAVRTIARQSFRTFALTALDLFWFARHTETRLRNFVVFNPSFDNSFRQAPLIGVCAHYGNWEIIGQAAALGGAPSVSVAATIRNPMIDRRLGRLRSLTGQQIVPQAGAARSLLRCLRENRRIGLLLDQNTRLSEGGRWVPFMGRPVPVSGVVELLARRTGAPVLPAYACVRMDGTYLADADPLIRVDPSDPPDSVTRAVMRSLEQRIRRDPGQWLWMYKRWKYVPPDEALDHYPYYARRKDDRSANDADG